MTGTALRKSIYLRATPAQVWAYLTEPEKLALWFHKPDAPMTDGPYAMYGKTSGEKVIWGEVTVAEPFSRLEYTFTVAPMGDAVSLVTWTLEEVAGGTHLSLVHDGLPQGAEAFDLMLALDKGWDEHLGQMRSSIHGE
jgi:uncharacterized protein YndB with AHSA1/START domain